MEAEADKDEGEADDALDVGGHCWAEPWLQIMMVFVLYKLVFFFFYTYACLQLQVLKSFSTFKNVFKNFLARLTTK